MKKLGLLLIVVVLLVLLTLPTGCAEAKMRKEVIHLDGTKDIFLVTVTTFGQDFSGSDLEATLDAKGKTKIKAGAVDNTTSEVSADVAKSFVELVGLMLPYMVAPAPPAP